MGQIRVVRYGVVEHEEMSDMMKILQQERIEDRIPDTLIFVEHPEVVTIGPKAIRDGVVVYSGEILTIYREKNQVKEVGTGLECGISIKDFIDFKEKDVIESYQADKIQRSI